MRTAGPGAVIGMALALCAALGSAEMGLRLLGTDEPAVLRRGLSLCLYAAGLYGSLGALLAAVGLGLGRLVGRPGRRGSRRDPIFSVTAAVLAQLVAVLGLLLVPLDVAAQPGIRRLAILAGLALGALVCGILFAWILRRGRAAFAILDRALRPARVASAAALVLVLVFAGAAARRPVAGAETAPGPAPRPDLPNLVMIVVDTLRPDVLGCYGAQAATPNIDQLAANGALFEEVVSSTSWTLPAVASLLTSSFPWQHGLTDYDRILGPETVALPVLLADAGYDCRAVVGNPLMTPDRGFHRGFATYDYDFRVPQSELLLVRSVDRGLRLLGAPHNPKRVLIPQPAARFPFVAMRPSLYPFDRELNGWLFDGEPLSRERPSFLYVHYTNPHSPYYRHPIAAYPRAEPIREDNLPAVRERYAQEVRHTDAVIGELLDRLDGLGLLEGAYVVLTSDHGEEFQEHGGWEHGYSLYQEVLRVPLIVAGPGLERGARIAERVQLVDVAPTVIDLLGLPQPASFAGASLRGLAAGEPLSAPGRTAFLELTSRFLNPGQRSYGALAGGLKLTLTTEGPEQTTSQEAFDLNEDPLERRPLGASSPELEALEAQLDAYISLAAARQAAPTAPADLEAMRALGYLGDDPPEEGER